MGKPETSRSLEPMASFVEAPFTDTVIMCSKCCRKLGDDGKPLRKRVKTAIENAYGDQVQLEKSDCFSLCPKGGQVLATAKKGQSHRLVIIEPDSNISRAVDYLLR
jgi:predicted metal-binding protein